MNGIPSPAVRAWHIWTEPELKDAIFAGWRGRSTPQQSELISAWVWARCTDYLWHELDDLLEAYRESLAELEEEEDLDAA